MPGTAHPMAAVTARVMAIPALLFTNPAAAAGVDSVGTEVDASTGAREGVESSGVTDGVDSAPDDAVGGVVVFPPMIGAPPSQPHTSYTNGGNKLHRSGWISANEPAWEAISTSAQE